MHLAKLKKNTSVNWTIQKATKASHKTQHHILKVFWHKDYIVL